MNGKLYVSKTFHHCNPLKALLVAGRHNTLEALLLVAAGF